MIPSKGWAKFDRNFSPITAHEVEKFLGRACSLHLWLVWTHCKETGPTRTCAKEIEESRTKKPAFTNWQDSGKILEFSVVIALHLQKSPKRNRILIIYLFVPGYSTHSTIILCLLNLDLASKPQTRNHHQKIRVRMKAWYADECDCFWIAFEKSSSLLFDWKSTSSLPASQSDPQVATKSCHAVSVAFAVKNLSHLGSGAAGAYQSSHTIIPSCHSHTAYPSKSICKYIFDLMHGEPCGRLPVETISREKQNIPRILVHLGATFQWWNHELTTFEVPELCTWVR